MLENPCIGGIRSIVYIHVRVHLLYAPCTVPEFDWRSDFGEKGWRGNRNKSLARKNPKQKIATNWTPPAEFIERLYIIV